ncbi:MAG: DUF2877 domain-containing protein [Armatimonadota bacterium]|nr:DUF2877 domain-containing protein [Armatimonadota bacterium]MDW8156115.1 DUF2877 domain-containing protein [Armatimonadota bacterium]
MRVLAYPSWLRPAGSSSAGRVLAAFRRSAYLEFPRTDAVVAVVAPELGRGPLSLVVEGLPREPLGRGTPARLSAGRLQVGHLTFELDAAAPWDATLPAAAPDPTQVRRCCEWLLSCAPRDSLAALVPHLAEGRGPALEAWQQRALAGARALAAGDLASGWGLLCGLGPGLTPAGDDFLCGWMLALFVTRRPRPWMPEAARSTHRIARSYLQAACLGQASEAWHRLVIALEGPHWETAARTVVSVGHTSGADALAGFLAGLRQLPA